MAKDKKKERPNRLEDRDKIGKALDFASMEAYNVLRSSLEFLTIDDGLRKGKIIGMTSPSPQEGKSLTSINLCYSLAKKENKVLLIDGDLRRPVLSKILNLPQEPGITSYLVDGEDQIIHKNVLIDGLSVITAGKIPPNPSELISSFAMQSILESLAKEYDYVVIDLPPINSVSDAFAVSGFLDGIAVVVRHGITRKGEVLEAVRQLEFANAKILGFVYNGYYEAPSYYYYRKNKYGYYYGGKYGKYSRYGKYYNNYGYYNYYSTPNTQEAKEDEEDK